MQGNWLDEPQSIYDSAVLFYKDLLSSTLAVHTHSLANFLEDVPLLLSASDNQTLLHPVEIHEVRDTVFDLEPDNAQGNDSFFGFFL